MKYVFFLLLIFGYTSAHGQGPCSTVQTGEFYIVLPDSSILNIKRTKNYQIETHNKSGTRLKSKIKWLSDCSYSVQLVKANKDYLQNQSDEVFKPLIVKIISIGDGFYYHTTYKDKETKPVVHGKVFIIDTK